jgi:TPR repeat protein
MKLLVLSTVLALVVGVGAMWYAVQGRVPPGEDAQRAVRAAIAAADGGAAAAQLDVGRRYLEGDGVPQDGGRAFQYLTQAARQGEAGAFALLGRMYENGDGVKRDFGRAALHYRAALRHGTSADAAFALGYLSLKGRGVAHDEIEAARLFRMAALDGHPAARFYTAAAAEEGWVDGVPDPVEAYVWYSLALDDAAAVQRVDSALDPVAARARLAQRMARYQIEQAERRLAAMRRTPPGG